ncbi:hypothetical protein BU23DRAFT_569745 [Bimuria novae-zelandiae CBS 107.79]|uniref:Uncharacterized protein n=1 Tax=Bimuria novae-zelandiae CBS 107.79 TaxID=1447943 RepID=A0A6A5V3Z7_9PLEO|nr:hypothetical protein BU23DRAFT_569745 [Bimuria novae-zelandiae CBS 107.79]
MRYDNWDVILFPKDSAVPIQEFKTACYTSQDEHQTFSGEIIRATNITDITPPDGRQVPTLTCYIASLPAAAPFRISIHSWISPAKPSALIESRKRSHQKVVYAIQVIVDGIRLFHGFHDATARWPQEILNEKWSAIGPQHSGSYLTFPQFHHNVLLQHSWDARDDNGRIKVLLSEQLIGKNSSPGELNLGPANDIVCFAFQHAPQDVLEQAGISWPIRNPLYLASGIGGCHVPKKHQSHAAVHDLTIGNRTRSSLSQLSPALLARPRNPEPFIRPSTDPPPHLSQFPKPTTDARRRQSKFWDPPFQDSGLFSGCYDDSRADSWSTKRTTSQSTLDTSMPDLLYASPVFDQPGDPWSSMNPPYQFQMGGHADGKQTRREKGARQVVVTLRDDQLGQIIEAISPPKKGHHRESTSRHPSIGTFTAQTTAHDPSGKVSESAPTHPSAAAVARKVSYQEFLQSRISPNKENLRPPQAQDGIHLPTGFSHAGRIPTPHPFAVPEAQMHRWDSDVSMRDTSSMFSGLSRRPLLRDDRASPAPVPNASGSIKSRKEGIATFTTSSPLELRHEQAIAQSDKARTDTPNVTSSHAHIEDIIDVDAIDEDFKPGHKGGTSSIDSTGRIERKLYSALGEELSFHADIRPMAGVESEAISGIDNSARIETPAASKRKRQGTLGGERDRSPIAKMVREEIDAARLGQSSESPRMRGGE